MWFVQFLDKVVVMPVVCCCLMLLCVVVLLLCRLRHPQEPSSTSRCECSRAEKWALKSTEDERDKCRKMRQKNPSSPPPRQKHRHKNSVHGIPARRCMITVTSTTPPVVAQRRACTPCPRTATAGPPQFSAHLDQTPLVQLDTLLHRPASTSQTPLPQRRTHSRFLRDL